MITCLRIENFRRFKNLTIDSLKRMTLISGKNNVGKTTVLEALFLLMDHTSQQSFLKLNSFRGTGNFGEESLWKPLFTDMDINSNIRISIEEDNENKKTDLVYKKDTEYLPISQVGVPDVVVTQLRSATRYAYSLAFQFHSAGYHEEGHFSTDGRNVLSDVKTNFGKNEIKRLSPTQYISSSIMRTQIDTAGSIGKMELANKKHDIVTILKQLDSSINDITTVSLHGIPQLYINMDGQLFPLQYAGDGVVKLLNIVLAIMEMENGIVLIDELETGFHYTAYERLWKIIDDVSKVTNCQIIATTHSYELIDAVVNGIERKDDFSYYRLGRSREGTAAYHYNYLELANALYSNMEVR